MSRRLIPTLALVSSFAGLACLGPVACDKKSDAAPEQAEGTPSAGSAGSAQAQAGENNLPDAKDLIAKHIEAAGGEEAARAVETLHLKSSYTLDKQNIEGAAEVWWQGGKFFATEEVTGFGTAMSGYDGNVVWSNDPSHGLRELEGKEAEQWVSGGAVFILPNWENYFETAETVAEGDATYDVAFTSKLGEVTTYSFDKETHLASSMSFKQILPEATIPVVVTLSDYRPIDGAGYQLPFKEVTDLKMAKMTKVYESIEAGVEVDATRFAKPGADGAVPAKPAGAEAGSATPQPDQAG